MAYVEYFRMKDCQLNILLSPIFLASLCLLLLNDLFLKHQLHNRFTGKLSDFAGLLVFSLFWIAFFPRYKVAICILIALLFVYWKSIYSQSFIEAWNGLLLFSIGRTVDHSDLLALTVLPFSHCLAMRKPQIATLRWPYSVVIIFSVFAFTATSYQTQFEYTNEYQFQVSRSELINFINNLSLAEYELRQPLSENLSESYSIIIGNEDICSPSVRAVIVIYESNGQGVIRLMQMSHVCSEGTGDKQRMLEAFESQFINKIKLANPPSNNTLNRTRLQHVSYLRRSLRAGYRGR